MAETELVEGKTCLPQEQIIKYKYAFMQSNYFFHDLLLSIDLSQLFFLPSLSSRTREKRPQHLACIDQPRHSTFSSHHTYSKDTSSAQAVLKTTMGRRVL